MWIVRTLRQANHLVENGFKIQATIIDKDNPSYNVFGFEDTEKLHLALEEYHNRDRSLDVKS